MVTFTLIQTIVTLTFIVLHTINKEKIKDLEKENKILKKKLGEK